MYRIDLMTPDDVSEVSRVERRCFSNPWPASAYKRELQNPAQNYYVLVRDVPVVGSASPGDDAAGLVAGGGDGTRGANGSGPARSMPRRTLFPLGFGRRAEEGTGSRPHAAGRIVGFAGMWNAFDEAHVTTIAVEAAHRGRSLGEWMLATLFDEAVRRGVNWLTLEVRVSNEAAQALYRKWGFSVQGVRRRYYSDNNEDALIMWSRALGDDAYRAEIADLRAQLAYRLAGSTVAGAPVLAGAAGRTAVGR